MRNAECKSHAGRKDLLMVVEADECQDWSRQLAGAHERKGGMEYRGLSPNSGCGSGALRAGYVLRSKCWPTC